MAESCMACTLFHRLCLKICMSIMAAMGCWDHCVCMSLHGCMIGCRPQQVSSSWRGHAARGLGGGWRSRLHLHYHRFCSARAHVHTHDRTHILTYTRAHARARARTHTHTHTLTLTHTYTHVHVPVAVLHWDVVIDQYLRLHGAELWTW